MENVVILKPNIQIRCPLCRRKQTMRYAANSEIYYPCAPFCCDAMRNLDTLEWNVKLNEEIAKVI